MVGARFCGHCGSELPTTGSPVCSSCGATGTPADDSGGAAAAVADWLDSSDLGWLDGVECEAIPAGCVGKAEADQMLRWHRLYKALASALPNLAITVGALDALTDPDAGRELVPGPLPECSTWTVMGWDFLVDEVGVGGVVAAGVLGRIGELEAVLVASAILAHRYEYFGGDGRPLVDGYRIFLPAVASFESATSGKDLANLDLPPGWWDAEDNGPMRIGPDALARVVNPSLTPLERRILVGNQPDEQCDTPTFLMAAVALGLDSSFLTDDEAKQAREHVTQQLDWLASASRDEIDPDDEGLYDDLMDEVEPSWSQLLLTCTLATRLDELLEDTQDVGKESAAVLEAIQGRHAWIVDWQDYGWWTQADAWPEGPFREAIAARPEDDVW